MPANEIVSVPLYYPTTTIYVDESGAATKGRFFVVGALKVRKHGAFSRSLRAVRDRHEFNHEFHFSGVTRGVLPAYYDLIDTLAATEVHFHATVIDRQVFDPSVTWPSVWESHANVTAQLLRGCLNRRELVSVLMDTISTPADVAYEDYVRDAVNQAFRNTCIVNAVLLDSKTCDGLQAVDLLAGALAWERRSAASGHRPNNEKAKLADRVRQRFNIDFSDNRTPRTNILTLHQLPTRRRRPVAEPPPATGT